MKKAKGHQQQQQEGGRRFRGIGMLLVGGVLLWTGSSLWRSPSLDWETLKDTAWQVSLWTGHELNRLYRDPLAVVGMVVLLGGLLLAWGGFVRAFRGK